MFHVNSLEHAEEETNEEKKLDSDSDHGSATLETVSGFSSSSSPLPPEPFSPLFSVKFTGPVEKDGDVVKYTVKTRRKSDDSEYVIQRQYEDFEWLDHCLVTSTALPGLIVPPLPQKPAITSEMAEAKSKKQLGSDTKTLMGDQFNKDCLHLEQYVSSLLSHHIFGKSEVLASFLIEKEPPIRAKIKRSLLSRISDSLTTKNNSHKDCEEFFQSERDFSAKYGSQIKETSEIFNSMLFSQQRLCAVLGHLATAFTLSGGPNDNFTKSGLKLCNLFSEALEISRHGIEVVSYNDEITLGAYLDLYTRYFESEREMLYQRTSLLMEYETANKALDKVEKTKPQKPDVVAKAEAEKLKSEKVFEKCSDVARQELKRFHRQRISKFQESLERFASAQLRTAKDVSAMLAKSLTELKQFEVISETNSDLKQ